MTLYEIKESCMMGNPGSLFFIVSRLCNFDAPLVPSPSVLTFLIPSETYLRLSLTDANAVLYV